VVYFYLSLMHDMAGHGFVGVSISKAKAYVGTLILNYQPALL
jgi:hypothetical protein